MSAQQAQPKPKPVVARQKKLTVEDIRRKAERVQEIARDDAERLMQAQRTRAVIYAAVGVAVAVSVAYYMGTRTGRRPAMPSPTPE